jgi:hypothetical protein
MAPRGHACLVRAKARRNQKDITNGSKYCMLHAGFLWRLVEIIQQIELYPGSEKCGTNRFIMFGL